jgi:MFS family permease
MPQGLRRLPASPVGLQLLQSLAAIWQVAFFADGYLTRSLTAAYSQAYHFSAQRRCWHSRFCQPRHSHFLGIIGFAYGGTIATYPAAIANLFPGEDGPRAYGRIFTAWGTAGLMAPWLAGQIYDWYGTYTTALWVAAVLGILSAVTSQKAIQKD